MSPVIQKKKEKPTKPKSPAPTNGESPSTSNSSDLVSSSVQRGAEAFEHLLSGTALKKFMVQNWEKRPLYIERGDGSHYDHLKVSTEAIDEMLRTNYIEFTKNVDITSYENGLRETHNPDGRALPGTVWGFYKDGCSVRKCLLKTNEKLLVPLSI